MGNGKVLENGLLPVRGTDSRIGVTLLKALKKQVKTLDELNAKAVENEKASTRKVEIMRSVKGMGPVAISTFVAELPELGKLNRRKLPSL